MMVLKCDHLRAHNIITNNNWTYISPVLQATRWISFMHFKGVRTPNSTLFDLLQNFYLNNFWYATSESVKKKLRVEGEISEIKLIKDTKNSLLLIDVHVKLQ